MREPKLEFSRLLQVDRIPAKGSFEKLSAEPKECVALAKRYGIPAVHSLRTAFRATPWRGGGVKVAGEVTAEIDQVSVVSLETFTSTETFEVERYFMPQGKASSNEEDIDIDEIINGEIDLGEVAAETVGLELEPYPRKPGEAFEGFEDEPEEAGPAKVSPFAVLKKT
jgi:uncharacterized metal-binding protein YceD (DUF177 family)